MNKKTSYSFICQKCSYESFKWLGKCPQCHEWNTLEEKQDYQKKILSQNNHEDENTPLPIQDIGTELHQQNPTGINEFDRVLGAGLTIGSLTLIGGEPGIGKSTLLMQVMGSLAKKYPDKKILYVSGEESNKQIANRSKRLNVEESNIYILNENNWQKIAAHTSKLRPSFLVIDSIQTSISVDIASPPGTVAQVREVTYEIMNLSKAKNITSLVIGHITKEGIIAGPKILEHMVDTVIYFEGDQFGHYRILRAVKNRFGNTNEIGIFEMSPNGLSEVPNPSQYFLDESFARSEGRTLTCILEGSRTLFVEIQSLVVENKFGTGRRTTQGIDSNRLAMLIAVVEKHCHMPIGYNDIYVNIVGGIRPKGRDGDLAICASLISSYKNIVIPNDTIFVGEVGLTGEVRSVPRIESRLKEMIQLNYKHFITGERIAKKLSKQNNGIKITGIKNTIDLLNCFKHWTNKKYTSNGHPQP